MGSFPQRTRLPTSHYTNIGRVVMRYALIEARVQRILYALAETGPKTGRAAIRSPRVKDAFVMIEDVLAIRGFTSTKVNISKLSSVCQKIEGFRDKLAHGVWVRHANSKSPILQVIKGSYPETPGGNSHKARINPQSLDVTPETFQSFLNGIRLVLKAIADLARDVERQRRASHRKSLSQLAQSASRKRPRRTQNQSKRQPPPQS